MSDLIYTQIAKIMAGIPIIGKDRDAGSGNFSYKFRGIDEVYNALHPLLAEHKVFPMPEVLEVERERVKTDKGKTQIHTTVKVKYTFYAEDGSNVSCVTIGEGMDSGDKSGNKAMSGAEKYAFFQVFCIPTDEPKDSENDSPELDDAKATGQKAGEPVKDAAYWKALADKNTNHIKNLKAWYAKHKAEIQQLTKAQQDEINLHVKALGEKLEKELADKKAAEQASSGGDSEADAIAKDADRGSGETPPSEHSDVEPF